MRILSLELLDYIPDAKWLPLALDTKYWAPNPAAKHNPKPVVAFLASGKTEQESELLKNALAGLANMISIREIEPGPAAAVRRAMREADLFIDQLSIGDYSYAAIQAMALGKPVISYVSERTLARLPEDVPMHNATLDQLEDALSKMLTQRPEWQNLGRAARSYVNTWRDGRESALILATAMGLRS